MNLTKTVHYVCGISILILAGQPCASADKTPALMLNLLSNEGIVSMAEAGYDQEFLTNLIQQKATHFDTSVEGLAYLAGHGISQTRVQFMVEHENVSAGQPITGAAADS